LRQKTWTHLSIGKVVPLLPAGTLRLAQPLWGTRTVDVRVARHQVGPVLAGSVEGTRDWNRLLAAER